MEAPLTLPTTTDRAALHAALFPQVQALIAGEADPIAAMANVAAAVREAFGWHWVGFYRVVGNELVLGPFQGPIACTRIAWGKGVCGTAWKEDRVLVVPHVELFPGHIACSALSRSEIVLPIHDRQGRVVVVFDIDSSVADDFSSADVDGLKRLCELMEPLS